MFYFQLLYCCHSGLLIGRYDPRHNSWCTIESLQQQHADHCVCVVDKYIYAIGGRDYTNELECVERYNPQTNTWEYVAPMKREVSDFRRTQGTELGVTLVISNGYKAFHY